MRLEDLIRKFSLEQLVEHNRNEKGNDVNPGNISTFQNIKFIDDKRYDISKLSRDNFKKNKTKTSTKRKY